jgi:hypothetical protein
MKHITPTGEVENKSFYSRVNSEKRLEVKQDVSLTK